MGDSPRNGIPSKRERVGEGGIVTREGPYLLKAYFF